MKVFLDWLSLCSVSNELRPKASVAARVSRLFTASEAGRCSTRREGRSRTRAAMMIIAKQPSRRGSDDDQQAHPRKASKTLDPDTGAGPIQCSQTQSIEPTFRRTIEVKVTLGSVSGIVQEIVQEIVGKGTGEGDSSSTRSTKKSHW